MADYSRQEWYGELEAQPQLVTAEEGLALAEEARQSLLLAFLTASLLLPLCAAIAYGINLVENSGLLGIADAPFQPWVVPASFVLIGRIVFGRRGF